MLDTLNKLFELLSDRERKHLFLILIAVIVMAIIEMAGIASIMPFMAVVANPDVVANNRWLIRIFDFFQFTTIENFLFFLGLVVLGILIFSNLVKALTTWVILRFDNRLNYHLSRRLLGQYLSRPYAFFLDHNTADMGKNILTEVRTVVAGVLSPCMQVISNVLICLLIFALLVVVDPYVALTIAGIVGGTYIALYLFVRRRLGRIGKEQVEANLMKYKVAGEALSGIKDLKILGCERSFLQHFSTHAKRHSRNNVMAGVISLLPKYILEIFSFGGLLIIVLHYLGSARGPEHMIPLLALYAFAGYRLMPAVQSIFIGVATVKFSLAALEILHRELVETTVGDPDLVLPDPEVIAPLSFTNKLELRNLTFSYTENKESILKNINLSIKINSTIGLVGGTGSGKTTLVDIILGLLHPLSGEMLVDEQVIDHTNIYNWQRNIGYVPQSIFLCDDTVAHNIAFGVPADKIDMEAVKQAARVANLDHFITTEMPQGYETEIGERGIRLSGGQRQRLGIARALYRNPSVLVLDEATNALDGITETAVMDAIQNLAGKKTIILVAHRLTTLKKCDVIYHLERGSIVDQGTYAELQKSSSWFSFAANQN